MVGWLHNSSHHCYAVKYPELGKNIYIYTYTQASNRISEWLLSDTVDGPAKSRTTKPDFASAGGKRGWLFGGVSPVRAESVAGCVVRRLRRLRRLRRHAPCHFVWQVWHVYGTYGTGWAVVTRLVSEDCVSLRFLRGQRFAWLLSTWSIYIDKLYPIKSFI